MTECTEVSYIVPSYFFLRCRKSSEEIRVAEKYGRDKSCNFMNMLCLPRSENYTAFFFNLASPTSQRITLIYVKIT